MKTLLRNAEGYLDLTPYNAIKNIDDGGENMEFRKGEIFEITLKMGETRYALVVSSDERAGDKYLNTITLNDNPVGRVNVPVNCHGMKFADCGFVAYTASEKLGNFVRKATDKEIAEVDAGIMRSLGISVQWSPTEENDNLKLKLEGAERNLEEVKKELETEQNKSAELEEELGAYKEALAELKKAKQEQEIKAYNDSIAIRTERDLYKNLYEQTLKMLVGR